jgi:hypothetical protein
LWNERISHGFDLNYDFFNNKDILEVGCGATGIIFFLKNAKTKIGTYLSTADELKMGILPSCTIMYRSAGYRRSGFYVVVHVNFPWTFVHVVVTVVPLGLLQAPSDGLPFPL